MRRVVEPGVIAGPDIDRSDAEAHGPGVDPFEIHQALERAFQRHHVVVAQRRDVAERNKEPRRQTRLEEARCAEKCDREGMRLIEQAVRGRVLYFDRGL
jgi:hypothetical protein